MTGDWQKRAPAVLESYAALRQRTYDLAIERRHREADVVHLAATLLQESSVHRAVEACGADVADVTTLVDGTMDEQPPRSWWQLGRPRESRRLVEVYEGALVHALSSEIDRVTPVGLLVRLLTQRPPALIAERLDAMGVEPLPLMRWDAHGRADDPPLPRGDGPARVVFLNDPYTTMEVVVELLRRFFELEPKAAEAMMRRIHQHGRGTIPFGRWEDARRQAAAARDEARRRGYPLELTVEPNP